MTDRERYKRTFALLHASGEWMMEDRAMSKNNIRIMPVRRLAAVCAAAALVVMMATVAYAADVGGIQRTVQVWIHGDQTNAVLDIRANGSYTLTYQDEEGRDKTVGGGGVAIDAFGKERPLTEDEILEELNSPEVEYLEDGTVWVYYQGQKLEITDQFENGVCYVQLKDGEKVLYLTVRYQDGYSTSAHSFLTEKTQKHSEKSGIFG